MTFSAPKGLFDILPASALPKDGDQWRHSERWHHLEDTIRSVARCYGFSEIRTPIFEKTELFQRGVGDSSDIVNKEMYTFEDKGKRLMTLRPEGTASVMRAYLEERLQNERAVQKLFYIGPMFRYERPQAGRYRQHHQFGIEAIGYAAPEQDAEVIDLLYTLLCRLGLKNLRVKLNSIGSADCRQGFRDRLRSYLQPHLASLSADSQQRFETNPLRILDSKDPKDKEIVAGAPSILEGLNDESRDHFEVVKTLLDRLNIPYDISPLLVRGLDYYNKTVFEVVSDELGAQNSVGGGGRYDGLIKTLGGPDLPAIGFGSGMERIIQTMLKQKVDHPQPAGPELFIVPLGESTKKTCFDLLASFRQQGIPVEMDFSGRKLKKVLSYADRIFARHVVVIGEDEIQQQKVKLKEMASGKETTIQLNELTAYFIERTGKSL